MAWEEYIVVDSSVGIALRSFHAQYTLSGMATAFVRHREESMPVTTAEPYAGHNQDMINPFIEQFVRNIEICNRKHYTTCIGNWGYPHHNLLYREREIYSLMAAAMHKLTPVHQSESKVIRRRDRRNPRNRGREQEGNGRVDLWAHKDDIDYYFEFKRSYVGLNGLFNGEVPDRIHRPWTNLIEQVNQVRNGPGLRNEPNTCCIGLQVITPYKSGENRDRLLNQRELGDAEIKSFIEEFHPMPDAVLWYLSGRRSRIVPIKWDEQDNETRWVLHPYHLFLFTIFSC